MLSSPRARALSGPVLLVWITLLSLVSLRVQDDGPYWGIELVEAPGESGARVAVIDRHGTGWSRDLRVGSRVLRVGDEDARAYVGQPVPPVAQLTFVDVAGVERTARPVTSTTVLLGLVVTAFLCAALAGVVHRWSPDPTLGTLFFLFAGSLATGLAAVSVGNMGYTWAYVLLNGIVAFVVPTSFALFALYFPRPVRGAKTIAIGLVAVTVVLMVATIAAQAARDDAHRAYANSPRNMAVMVCQATALVIGMLALGSRLLNPVERSSMKPVAVGVASGLLPYLLAGLLQHLLTGTSATSPSTLGLAIVTVPVAFAYAILRHRLLALDALMRRAVSRVCAVAVLVLGFVALWMGLQGLGADVQVGGVLAATALALAAPAVLGRTKEALDAWLYPRLDPSFSSQQLYESGTVPEVATALVRRARDLLPVQWVACYAHDEVESDCPLDGPWRRIAAEGAAPEALARWFAGEPSGLAVDEAQVAVLEHAGLTLGVLVIGPRLDGTSAPNPDLEAIAQLGKRGAVLLEVALRRAASSASVRYHEGLSELDRDLATARSQSAVFQATAEHTRRLLHVDEVAVWRRREDGTLANVARGGDTILPSLPSAVDEISGLFGPDVARRLGEQHVARVAPSSLPPRPSQPACPLLAFVGGGDSPGSLLVVAVRLPASPPFAPTDERRAREIAEHVWSRLRSAPRAERSRPTAVGLALTPREREIAVLIAQGFTNRQIARQLGIAEGTAGKHIEHIMAKLGFQSRAQVAAWAVEQGLATAPQPAPDSPA